MGKNRFIIATTHLLCNPNATTIQLGQAKAVTHSIRKMIGEKYEALFTCY